MTLNEMQEALISSDGNVSEAARKLGIARSTFKSRLDHLEREELKEGGSAKKYSKAQSEINRLKKQLDRAEEQVRALRSKKKVISGKAKPKPKGSYTRVVIPDTHGCYIDKPAVKAFLRDLKDLDPREIVMLGDHLDCGGFLAMHHTMCYVAETAYTFKDDVAAANELLDRVQEAAPNAKIHMLQGNHERRIEKWVVTQVLRNNEDAEYLSTLFSAQKVLALEERGIEYYVENEFHHGLKIRGAIKLGKCHFTHGISTARHAASVTVKKFGGSVVYGHCFSSDTELLTERGWITFDRLIVGEKAATVSLENGSFEWQPVKDVFSYGDYKEMVHFKSPSVDAMVTDEHAMVTVSRKSRDMSGATLSTLKRVPAKDLIEKSAFAMPQSGVNLQKDYPITDSLLKLLAWVICEGCYETNNGHEGYVRISQSDKPKVSHKRIEDLLDEEGFSYSSSKRHEAGSVDHGQQRNYDAYRIYLKRKTDDDKKRVDHLISLSPQKIIPEWVMSLSTRQFRLFFHELILADGSKNSSAVNSYQFSTQHIKEADLLQAACAMNGMRSTLNSRKMIQNKSQKMQHYVTVNTRGLTHITSTKPVRVPYSGKVWCCSVDNQTLITRRNGKVLVCGNTHRADSDIIRTVNEGAIGAWSPGCLCEIQPYYGYTNLTDWSHGYGLQFVQKDGRFLHLNVPIVEGVSMMPSFSLV